MYMNAKFKNLQLQTLANHLAGIKICERPSDGWIACVRKSLGMSVRQLAKRTGVAVQSISKFEKNELDDAITLKSLRKIAEAMDCRLVYAMVPINGNLEDSVKKQARLKAAEIISPVAHTMLLEAQEVGDKQSKISELANELISSSKLWE